MRTIFWYPLYFFAVVDAECDGGWKYNPNSNTFYCYHGDTGLSHADVMAMCTFLTGDPFPQPELVSIESVEEHQFIIDNVPTPPGRPLIHDTHIMY